ncbi:MAG: zinc ribbon domain-containing protein, partial [Dehalococcoidia bacterium]
PIYQYDCAGCRKRVEVFFRSVSRVANPVCPECGSKDLQRAVSRIARTRSTREAIESIDFNQELGRLEGKDEKSFARWARQMGDQYDGALGTDFGDLAAQADSGLDPSARADVEFTLKNKISRAKERLVDSSDAGDA